MDESCSTACGVKETKRYDWVLVQEFDSHDDLDDFLLFKILNSLATGSRSSEIKCKYNKDHGMDVQRRRCDDCLECPVKYKVQKCDVCNKYQLWSANLHNHEILDEYDNTNGFSKCYNEMILKYVSFNINHKMIDKEGKSGAAKFLMVSGFTTALTYGKFTIHRLVFRLRNRLSSHLIRK